MPHFATDAPLCVCLALVAYPFFFCCRWCAIFSERRLRLESILWSFLGVFGTCARYANFIPFMCHVDASDMCS